MNSEKVKEIKKALECCGMYKYDCEKCPYKSKGDDDDLTVNNGCGDLLLKDCTTLINELEKELEKEQINNLNCDTELQYKEKRIAELEKENERLKNRITCQVVIPNDKLEEIKKECLKKVEVDKDKSLKQFAERLKEKLKEKVNADNVDVFVECARLSDETLKEFINKGDEER